MKNLFDPAAAEHIKQRLAHLKPDSPRQWGSMNPAQAMAHCAAGLQLAAGELKPPRALIGYAIGWAIKPLALGNDDPIRRNAPTVKGLVIHDDRNLDKERQLLARSIDRFVAAGPAGCTTHPHSFFGRLTPQQWAILMYKHLDHHLRQFGA
jgi:hypothetical protein